MPSVNKTAERVINMTSKTECIFLIYLIFQLYIIIVLHEFNISHLLILIHKTVNLFFKPDGKCHLNMQWT